MRVFDDKSETVFVLSEHSAEVFEVLSVGQQHQHALLLERQKGQLEIAAVDHVHLPKVEEVLELNFA